MSKPGRSKSGAQPAVEQRRSVVLKRTFDPPVVKTQVVAGGAVTIPVTQDRIDRSVPDDILYRRYQVCQEETEADETVPPIQIILTKSIEEFGNRGQVLTMPSDKAHKELLYHGLAVYASPDNMKTYKDILIPEDAVQFSSKAVQQSYSELSRKVICLHMHDTNPWSLEAWHLRLALRRHGVAVDTPDECLSFRPLKGPSPSLQGREMIVRLKVNSFEDIRLRVVIYQTSSDLGGDVANDDADEEVDGAGDFQDILAKEEIPPPGWEWMFNPPVFEEEREELAQIPRNEMTEELVKEMPALRPHFEKYKQWRLKRDESIAMKSS